ncbi:hypothetical protein KKY_607 [Pelagibacterium halotolerans B2]|uniref:Uncharacterized protein n=1 Tax=Pelagibacterium halotolerans (strain DSM 22347 / JCM 15775 / CGMCC 1.7692 / B2) TaxID=1082931 RepID=G4RCH4_PELHB|nr:hypothetical protein KKY_607 [Pelagibacterium halotolerans B2]
MRGQKNLQTFSVRPRNKVKGMRGQTNLQTLSVRPRDRALIGSCPIAFDQV